jgi:CAAX prenyl protease-like protein
LLIVPGLLIWAWRWYKPLSGDKSAVVSIVAGILAGVAGTVLWILLITPFIQSDAVAWENPAFSLRLAASTLMVPVFEELLMRGYVFFFVLQWDQERRKGTKAAFDVTLHDASINDVRTVYWNVPAIIISTVMFTLGHQVAEWPAAIAYGLLMAFLFLLRKDLLSCVVAHGITNLCLGIYVLRSGNWQYW